MCKDLSLNLSELLSFESKEVWEVEEFHPLILQMEQEKPTTTCLSLKSARNCRKFYNFFSVLLNFLSSIY